MTGRRVSAIVLAGGRSSRFGRDKLVEPIGERMLLQHAVDAVRPCATEIIVVTAPGSSAVVDGEVRLAHDSSPFEGPLMGLATGLAAAGEATVFLAAGDIPGLVPAVVDLLLGALDDPAVDLAVLADGDSPVPFPMAMRRDVAHVATARLIASGERRLFSLIDALACAVIEESAWRAMDPEGRSIRDIDTPADLP